MKEVIYIPYEKQDEYREAGWRIEPLTHSHQKEYALMAVREVEDDDEI